MLWIVPALLALMFIFPPIVRGQRAQHNALVIWMPRTLPGRAFVLVQEKGEYRLAKLPAIAVALAFALLTRVEPITLMLQPIAALAIDQITRQLPGSDWAGHGAEIMAAERAGEAGYREAEIARMLLHRDKPKSAAKIEAGLARWHWLGRIVHALGRW